MGDLLDFRKTEQTAKKLHKTLLSLSRESREDGGQLQEIGRHLYPDARTKKKRETLTAGRLF